MEGTDVVRVSNNGQLLLSEKARRHFKRYGGKKFVLVDKGNVITLRRLSSIQAKKLSEGAETYIASGMTLAKDWNYRGDDVWDEL